MSARQRERGQIAWAYAALAAGAVVLALALWRAIGAVTGLETGLWPSGWPVTWARPWALSLAAPAIAVWWLAVHRRRRRVPTLAFSRVSDAAATPPGWVARLASLPAVLRVIAIVLLAAALARPQAHLVEDIELEGIDVMFVLDLSRSMEAEDLEPSRLDASQRVIREFLAHQGGDRVGLVVFGRAPMLAAPLTLDTRALDEIVADLAIGDVPPRGTAIGDALGLALAVLRRSDAESRVVILLSDGDSNVTTEMSPSEAKYLAGELGVRVFTVLMGSEHGEGGYGVDPELLTAIARDTGGAYFRAADSDALASTLHDVREELDQSRHELRGASPGAEIFTLFAWPAVILLLLEVALRLTRWRRFP